MNDYKDLQEALYAMMDALEKNQLSEDDYPFTYKIYLEPGLLYTHRVSLFNTGEIEHNITDTQSETGGCY